MSNVQTHAVEHYPFHLIINKLHPLWLVAGVIFPKTYANAITRHEQKKTILSRATSVGNKWKQTEDRKTWVIFNIVSIVSSPSKKADQKEVHAIKDLLQCIMSSDWLVFALYLNHMSHPKMFLTIHLRTMRKSNQTNFRYIFVPYGHVIVPLSVILQICILLIFRKLLLLINASVHFRLFLLLLWLLLSFPNSFVLSPSLSLTLKIFLSLLSPPHFIIMT